MLHINCELIWFVFDHNETLVPKKPSGVTKRLQKHAHKQIVGLHLGDIIKSA